MSNIKKSFCKTNANYWLKWSPNVRKCKKSIFLVKISHLIQLVRLNVPFIYRSLVSLSSSFGCSITLFQLLWYLQIYFTSLRVELKPFESRITLKPEQRSLFSSWIKHLQSSAVGYARVLQTALNTTEGRVTPPADAQFREMTQTSAVQRILLYSALLSLGEKGRTRGYRMAF